MHWNEARKYNDMKEVIMRVSWLAGLAGLFLSLSGIILFLLAGKFEYLIYWAIAFALSGLLFRWSLR
jgi:formate/nitrite transporter FocA (FNT family)